MNLPELNVIIAEALGWTFVSPYFFSSIYPGGKTYTLQEKAEASMCWSPPGHMPWQTTMLPDFSGDLNLMRQAEHWLEYKCKEWFGEGLQDAPSAYMAHLKDVTGADYDEWLYVGASANQKAEAFRRTIGIDEDGNRIQLDPEYA